MRRRPALGDLVRLTVDDFGALRDSLAESAAARTADAAWCRRHRPAAAAILEGEAARLLALRESLGAVRS